MIHFKKRVIKDNIATDDGAVKQQGTPLTAEQMNQYENTIALLVEVVNQLQEKTIPALEQKIKEQDRYICRLQKDKDAFKEWMKRHAASDETNRLTDCYKYNDIMKTLSSHGLMNLGIDKGL